MRAPTPKFIVIKDFLGGYNSTLDDDRLPNNTLKTASNMQIEQNGTLRPRPSLTPYGIQPTNTIIGQVKPFIKLNANLPEKWEASMQSNGTTASVNVRKDDGGAFTVLTGKTYNATATAHFEPIGGKLAVSNGVDNLSVVDIVSLTVVPFTALTTPTGLAGVQTGLTGTNFTYYYQVTANNQGTTAASASATVPVSLLRSQWQASTMNVTLTFNRVTGAARYTLYIGTSATNCVYLINIADPGTGTTVSYKDDGSAATNILSKAPTSDSTIGPRVTRTKNVAGQLFMVGDADNPYRLWYGSNTGPNPLDLSDFGGGGYVDINLGGENLPVAVDGFRDKAGNPAATVLSQGIAGHGTLTHAIPQTTTIGTTIISYLQLVQSESQSGTDAPDSLINYRQQLWYISRDGVKSSFTKPQLQNLLSTESLSGGILGDIAQLNVKSLSSAVGCAYLNRLYFLLAVNGTINNQLWQLDLDRGQAWMLPWYINGSWIWVSDDNNGVTRLKILSNNQIYTVSYDNFTRDDQTTVQTNAVSGLLKADPAGNNWMDVSSVKVTYLRPQGQITFSVAGKTEDNPLITLGTDTYNASAATTDRGVNEFPWNRAGWNKVGVVPTTFGVQSITRYIEIDEEVNYLQYSISSNTPGTDFQVSKIVVTYVDIGPKDADNN